MAVVGEDRFATSAHVATLARDGGKQMNLLILGALMAVTEVAAAEAPPPPPPTLSGGKALIRCKLIAGGKLDACTVLSEDPAGAGFGDMALRLSKEMRFRGGAVGGTVKIPIAFEPPKQKGSRQ